MKNITSIAFLLLFGFFLNAANATSIQRAANATSIQRPILNESTFEKYEIINPVRIAGEAAVGITQPSITSSIKDYKMLLNAASTNPKVTPVILEQSKLIAVRDTCVYLASQIYNAIIDTDLSNATDYNKNIQDKVFNDFMADYNKEGTNGERLFTESEITLMTTIITTNVKIYNTLGFTTPSFTFDINYGQTNPINPSDIGVSTNMNSSSQTNLTQHHGYSGSPVNPL